MMKNGSKLQADGREYTILRQIGEGAHTAAYLASCRHGLLDTKCILKEFVPKNDEKIAVQKARFLAAGEMQNAIRHSACLMNQTPPLSHIFEVNGTVIIDIPCFGGTTLDKLQSLTLPQYIAICETVARTVGYYHQAGFLCLDVKPENLFILQNAPDDTLTQLVEFIDFDSVRKQDELNENTPIFCTREWAPPELQTLYEPARIDMTADIYTVGELVFFLLFGRHSTEQEHRGFSRYPFADCPARFRKYAERPDIQALFTRLFRGTIRSSQANRFQDMSEVAALLEALVQGLNRREYIIPVLPAISPIFVGRDAELRAISEHLRSNRVLFLTGVGGIGKSTLIRNFLDRSRAEYEVLVYLEFDGDVRRTFADDSQLQLSTVSRMIGESVEDYFSRKLAAFKRICAEKHVLLVLDNFAGKLDMDLRLLLNCGYDSVILTRNQLPKNAYAVMEVGAISDRTALFRLISLNLERPLTREERLCFEEIIDLVQGHTLVLELIARQIAAGRLDVRRALDLIREYGFSRFSVEKIGNYKDGEELYDTLAAIISALFDAGGMTAQERLTLQTLALFDVHGLESDLLRDIIKLDIPTISKLSADGWLYMGKRVRLHPVIAETARNWPWTADDVTVMTFHKRVIDVYVGMANTAQIREILQEAERFRAEHPRHIIAGMYYDMLGCYYDTLLGGAYYTETPEEADLLDKLTDAMGNAIAETRLSTDGHSVEFQTQYCLSMAGVLIRSTPKYYSEAADLLTYLQEIIDQHEPQISANRCYLCMVNAWYYTLAEKDFPKMRDFVKQGEAIARQVFRTDLELIDIIFIPAANCLFYFDEYEMAAETLETASDLCRQHPDSLPYIDKLAELLNCQLDIHFELGNLPKCRRLIAEIDAINEQYREQGIYREVSSEIRNKAGS